MGGMEYLSGGDDAFYTGEVFSSRRTGNLSRRKGAKDAKEKI
jgi:hypothetical protein